MLTPHSTEKSLVLYHGYNQSPGWLRMTDEERAEVEISVEDLIKEVAVDIEQGKYMRSAVLTLRDRLHAVLETLTNSEIDLARIIDPPEVK